MTRRQALALLAILTLTAAGLRFYQLRRLPPGLWYDEAWISLRARDMAATGVYPIYFAAPFGGNHAAVVYLAWLSRALTDNDPQALRYGVAAVGVLLTPLTYLALRAVLTLDDENEPTARAAALVGASGMALSVPLVVLSRVGFEVLLPALGGCVLLWALARAWQTGSLPAYGLIGVALSFALNTYSAARFFPLALILIAVGGWRWRARRPWRLGGWLLAGLVAGGLTLPLGLYFWRHPDIFSARAATASYNTLGPGAASIPLALARNLGRTLAGLSWPGFGDGLLRHNEPGRPFFDPWFSVYFWSGAALLWRRRAQPGALVLAVWAAVMTLPVIMTDGAPTFTRWLSAFPALTGIGGLGAVWLTQQVGGRARIRPNLLLLAGFLFSAVWAGWHYFGRYAHDPGLFDAFQVGDWQAATLAQQRLATDSVYLIPDLINDSSPTFDLLLRGRGAQGLPPDCLAYVPGRPTTYIVQSGLDTAAWPALAVWAGGVAEAPIRHQPSGEPLYAVWRLPAAIAPHLAHNADAQFGPSLRLLGYDVARETQAWRVQLVWQVTGALSAESIPFLHRYPGDQIQAPPATQSDGPPCGGGYPFSRWSVGEIVREERRVPIPDGDSAETDTLALGVYAWPSLQRLPLSADAGVLPDNRLRLLPLP